MSILQGGAAQLRQTLKYTFEHIRFGKKTHRSLSMVPRKDHAKSRKSYLPYVINSRNILLYDVF